MLNLKESDSLTKQDILGKALVLIKQQEPIRAAAANPATIAPKPTLLSSTDRNDSLNGTLEKVELVDWTERDLTPFYDHNRCIALLNSTGHHCYKPAKLVCRHAKVIFVMSK